MTIDVLIAHEGARAAVLAALQLPAPLGKLLVQYLAMFRPPKRQLSWERVSTILEELRAPIAGAQIERHGRVWPAPQEYWRAALEQMVQLRDQKKLQLPLKSHGYLLEVIAGMSNKAEEKAEARGDTIRASGMSAPPDVPTNGNPGFKVGDQVEIVWGKYSGWFGAIYSIAPGYASLEDLRKPTGEPTRETCSVPYRELRAIE